VSSTSAIIVAAGVGKRMNSSTPKQFMTINHRPILYYTLKNFGPIKSISEIILVLSNDFIGSDVINTALPPDLQVPLKLIAGGKRRQDSVWNGINAANESNSIISVHDGVRPFVASDKITKSIELCQKYDGAILAVPAVDTLKIVENSMVQGTIDRRNIWQVQTPQTFRRDILIQAFEKAEAEGFCGTDEASLAERINANIAVVPGSKYNIKITVPEDVVIAESLLKRNYNEN